MKKGAEAGFLIFNYVSHVYAFNSNFKNIQVVWRISELVIESSFFLKLNRNIFSERMLFQETAFEVCLLFVC